MTGRSDFTDEEWARLVRAPFVAGMAISLADPGGPFEMGKETMATIRSATNPPSREQLLAEVALDVQAMVQAHHNPVKELKLDKHAVESPGQQVLAEMQAAVALVRSKATAEEATAFGEWMVATAQDAANAAKDGGFMGINAKRVSEREERMLEQVREAVSG